MEANIPVLPNARRVNIQESQFHINQFNQTMMVQAPAIDPALDILHRHRALEASHTSKTASNAPKCKPGTRTKAITDLTTWAKGHAADPGSPGKSVLWLRGPAGAGKTCIMRVVARICRQDGLLVGDYFFSTRAPGLDDETPFVATIVSHLIIAIPALDRPIRETIRSDPTIFEQSLELQVEKLISNHAATISSQGSAPRIIVVDGFDECRDQTQRARLLHLLYSLVTPPHSFRVVIASRPEYDIRTAFNQAPLKSITKILRLEEYEVDGEIYQYLSDEFARIRELHPAKESIPQEWPGEPTLRALTGKSSGIWAYPSTIIKYVGNPRRHPVELLKDVLGASSTATSGRPLAELDTLYKFILNPPDCNIPLMKRLLHVIIKITRLSSGLPLTTEAAERVTHRILSAPRLDKFLSLEKGTTEMVLCDLHSVLSVTEDLERPWIYLHHKSLEDYLCSPERSGDLYQSQADTHSDILTVCIHNVKLWNRKLVSPNANVQAVHPVLDYSCVALRHLLFKEKHFPPSVLDLDASIVCRCFAFARWHPPAQDEIKDFVNSFHKDMMFLSSLSAKRKRNAGGPVLRSGTCLNIGNISMQQIWHDLPLTGPPMERLKRYEEQRQGLFAQLDPSPPTGVNTTNLQDNALACPPLLADSSKSVRSKVSRRRPSLTESTSALKRPRRAQNHDSIGTPEPQAPGNADASSIRLPPSKSGKAGSSSDPVPELASSSVKVKVKPSSGQAHEPQLSALSSSTTLDHILDKSAQGTRDDPIIIE